tara:strand:+ start:40 stop:942 length:903 start_codon:yes stop_codon:yes gene_type:complete
MNNNIQANNNIQENNNNNNNNTITRNNNNQDYINKLEEYYKLKSKYDNDKNEILKRIRKKVNNRELDLRKGNEEYKNRISKITCYGKCKRNIGMFFGDDSTGAKRKLIARCGDIDNPCFNIEISKGSIKTEQDFVDYWKNEAQKDKLNIVRIKLDVLFNYLTNEDIDKEFNELREKVKEANEEYIEREMVLSNIVNNPDKEREITDLNNKLDNILLKQKIKLERFKKGQNTKLVKELVEEYSKDLIPLLDNLRNMKYEYTNVNYNKQTDKYVLSQKEILTDSLETFVGDDKPKVINYSFN